MASKPISDNSTDVRFVDDGPADSRFIDVNAILLTIKRHLRLFLAVSLIVAALVIATYFFITPRYEATAQIQVNTTQNKVVDTEQVTNSKLPDTYAVDTKVEIIKSRTVARRVVERLKLWQNPDYVSDAMKNAPNTPQNKEIKIADATGKVLASRKVARSGLAYVIDITYSSNSSTLAAQVANAIAEEAVQSDLENRMRATKAATVWLNNRLGQLRNQVMQAESAVQKFRAANNLLSKEAVDASAVDALSTMRTDLATAQADSAEKAARASSAAANNRSNSLGAGRSDSTVSSPLLANLRQERARVSGQIADMRTRYGERYPDLQRALNQQTDLDRQISEESRRIVSDLSADARSSSARVASLQGSIGQSSGRLISQNAAQVRLAELDRNAEALRVLYQAYLNRFRETSSQEGLETSDSSVLTNSSEPAFPTAPNPVIFLAIAILGGLAAGGVAVAVSEMSERGLRSTIDVRDKLGVRCLASIPQFRSALSAEERTHYKMLNPDFVVERPFSAYTESFRMLRTALRNPATKKNYQVVAITSALPKEGKTTTSVSLVRVAAMDKINAVLVETDIRRRGMKASRAAIDSGIIELLEGKAKLEDVLRKDEASGAYILPISGSDLIPGDIFTGAKFDQLLAQLRESFDLIVLDTGPVLPIAENRTICAKADVVAFIVRWGSTPTDASAAGIRLLQDVGANVKGAVLTQVDINAQKNWSRHDASAYHNLYKDYYS